ncbi:protein translocase subunit secE/sec61 gamma [Bartonella sp. CDC_skunk]|uniref:Protein translocase subunit SecE n=1 Tax=Bartonella rochalimae ATCC BAA-1498 TaxID=685782 RepID=E6YM89_9HYPH|nr:MULTISPECIES: preprotein translocase subunit SecE [Bartonella]AQX18215.1 protein translocase subunit secE/sec61 gamma [Bartonella sp. A1379B]AQX21212.1 protein translocase subunit secE/sec61 gamma [Bartonella sp. CDC_skunk]AQX22730.1 preprotein translocase subunit SecE [Bartonella sp. 11B]AQX23985.1 preprotein translocase subunit SecE [Bartonella sp. 114]AQX25179.1 protein translocase subunit secE/sec61 gamma [Bartonella sp. Coyote22sub2]
MVSKINPITFLKQVRAETAKVKWPSRRETVISTVMVLVVTALASVFFFVVDQTVNFGVWQGIDLLKYLFS